MNYHYRARTYSPELGRFVQPDPIGFAGWDTNLFRYVFNSPISFTDPTGLKFVYADVHARAVTNAVGENATGSAALVHIMAATSAEPVYVQTRDASEITIQSFVNGYTYSTDAIASGDRIAQSVDISADYGSRPSSTSSQALMAHELTHVLQLQQGRSGRLDEKLPNAIQSFYRRTALGGKCGR